MTKLPDLGGRPKSEELDILIELVDKYRAKFNTDIRAIRFVLSQNSNLMMRYGDKNDDYLRKIIRKRRKEKNRP